ncbi:uncharacterized protein [Nicotiana tomentosiformis]|uniref:uncharacterized protein n=1 Tax=Nicotiana tomentosiformis TaxID=4098 RepID=UPI00051C62D0|nr:uncharacterized protein LOC104106834 [Nicotiana tomentosiformis]
MRTDIAKLANQVQAIKLRSGKALEELPPKKYVPKEVFERLVPQPEVEAEKKDDEHMQEIEVRVNLPLIEVLQEVPKYAKYLRDIVANKRRLTVFKTVALTEEFSARVPSKIPPKLKDPGYFTIALAIRKHKVGRALCNLGESINLMPLSIFKKLKLGAPRPTTMTLQLVDQSLAVLEGIIEDVLVRVGKFIFPVEFIILDYMADEEVPIILGRPLLATGGALIDVREHKLKMRVHDKEVAFNVYKALNLPKHYEDLCMILVIEPKVIEPGIDVSVDDITKRSEPEKLQLVKNVKLCKRKIKKLRDKNLAHCEFEPGQSVFVLKSRLKLFPQKLQT